MGIVIPKEGKGVILYSQGTDRFAQLDQLLRGFLLAPQEPEQLKHERDSKS